MQRKLRSFKGICGSFRRFTGKANPLLSLTVLAVAVCFPQARAAEQKQEPLSSSRRQELAAVTAAASGRAAAPGKTSENKRRKQPPVAPPPHGVSSSAESGNTGQKAYRFTEPLRGMIDQWIAKKTPQFAAVQAASASDAEYCRRVWLDLAGTIPKATVARQFVADPDPQKREKLVDGLLHSPEFAQHFAEVFDVIFMRRINSGNIPPDDWRNFLRESFAANKPYDELVREILSADGTDLQTRCRARFYIDRQGERDEITRDVGRIFLGADLECAQCHDHPQIDDFRQEHYYGLAAFFIRTSLQKTKDRQFMLVEKAEGEVSFESVLDIRDKISTGPKTTKPRFFDGPELVDPVMAKTAEGNRPGAPAGSPLPKYSRLAGIARTITSSENKRFARSAANRLWSIMFGRGIIEPVEQDHSFNPPSHPELLDVLTAYLLQHKYDVRDLLREIALSQTYQRASARQNLAGTSAARPEWFAQMGLKPLAPEQLARAWMTACGPAQGPPASGDAVASAEKKMVPPAVKNPSKSGKKGDSGFFNHVVSLFGGTPGKPSSSFEATPMQALYLSNNAEVLQLTAPQSGNLADRLLHLSSPGETVPFAEELYWSVLTRPADPQDVADVREYLAGVPAAQREQAVRELIWALAATAEFRFNH